MRPFKLLPLFLIIFFACSNHQELLEESYRLHKTSNYERVIENISDILKKSPNNGDANFLYGCALFELGKFTEADSIFFDITMNPNIAANFNNKQFELLEFRRDLCRIAIRDISKIDSVKNVNTLKLNQIRLSIVGQM